MNTLFQRGQANEVDLIKSGKSPLEVMVILNRNYQKRLKTSGIKYR